MIDSVQLVWGHAIGTSERRARGRVEPLAPPVRLDLDRLGEHLGRADGEITSKTFGDGGPTRYGHWKTGTLELLYREGRLEARASLPKLVLGRNDVVLDERGVHNALRDLVTEVHELVDGCGVDGPPALTLREADPTRLDYCFQYEVPSVAFTLEHVKAAYAAARKLRTENVSPNGGRSLVWGYGTKRVIRMYDKVAELTARKEELPPDAELDVLLRYEIQDRRRPHLRLVHEDGYRAAAVRRELQNGIAKIGKIAMKDLDAILATYGDFPYRVPYVLSDLYLVDHDEAWPWVRKHVGRSTYFRMKQRVAVAAMTIGDVRLGIPDTAFDAGSSLWTSGLAAAA